MAPGGFTLLELLIAVLIVGILATLAIPNFGKSIEKAKVKDSQAVLSAVSSAERVYRLDQGGYGTLANLVNNNYLADPDAGNSNPDWDFAVSGSAAAYTATATRTGSGYSGNTVSIDQNYTGEPVYGGKIYNGTHPLRD